MRRYFWNLLIALDIFVNAIFWGERYQTISARWGESNTKVWLWKWGSIFLELFERNHTKLEREKYDKIKKIIGK